MTGISRTLKKWTPKEHVVAHEVAKTGEETRLVPKMPAATVDPVMPMADEEEIKRNKRRTASARGGGRASTIFTEGDKLGP